MITTSSAKILLKEFNKKKYQAFILSKDSELYLPAVSSLPGISATSQQDHFKKIISHDKDNHVCFISKNDHPHGFIWQSNSVQFKKAVRWGIIKPESMTGRVIAALGHYRVVTHERIAKGMISNTQYLKLTLLDHYHDRFEALQQLESLVNQNNHQQDYTEAVEHYVETLQTLCLNLETQFANTNLNHLNSSALLQLRDDMANDIDRAHTFLASLKTNHSLRAANRAQGHHSIMEFIKQQMTHNLYEFQGINQDITYSNKRTFALTRGELNDFIEDARKAIDDDKADPRNAVTAKHHGEFNTDSNTMLTYDFSSKKLSAKREREILLAISFIEGWDNIDYSDPLNPLLYNDTGSASLTTIKATRWQTHRNAKTFFKSIGYFLLNMVKRFFVTTQPWEEETGENKALPFHMVSTELRKKVIGSQPFWLTLVMFFKKIISTLSDAYRGVLNNGPGIKIKIPATIVNDWNATQALPSFEETIQQAEQEIVQINQIEQNRLKQLFNLCHYEPATLSPPISQLAVPDYPLTPGEQNDILTAVIRGLETFSSVFTHTIFAKDPIAGMIFTATGAIGTAAVLFPSISASIFGAAYVNWFSKFSYAMGSSKFAAAIAGGSTQAELFASAWDVLMHGPTSLTGEAVSEIADNSLAVASYFGMAYGIGYVLANGIAGHPIPWLSKRLKADLGTVPETGYPFIGAKIAVALYETCLGETTEPHCSTPSTTSSHEINKPFAQYEPMIKKFYWVHWLSKHAAALPKLSDTRLLNIQRHIDILFTKEEASSLKKIIYPEKTRSVIIQSLLIILAYIPAILRLILSVPMSLIACMKKNPHPWAPIQRASTDLLKKIAADLNRLVIAGIDLAHLLFSIAASFIKMTAFTTNMALSRLTSLVGLPISHLFHKTVAKVHTCFRQIGAFLYPARATKSVVFAHPIDTIKKTEHSYQQLMSSLNVNMTNTDAPSSEDYSHTIWHELADVTSRKKPLETLSNAEEETRSLMNELFDNKTVLMSY